MVLSGFRVYPYRLPHLEEKDGPFFDTFLALLVVLISATVVLQFCHLVPMSFLSLSYVVPTFIWYARQKPDVKKPSLDSRSSYLLIPIRFL